MNSRFISLISALVSGRKDNPSYRDPEWADPTPSWNNFCPRSERFSGQLDCPFQPRSCDQIERFFIISGTIFRTRVAHMFGNFLGYFEIHHSSSKICCGDFLGNFVKFWLLCKFSANFHPRFSEQYFRAEHCQGILMFVRGDSRFPAVFWRKNETKFSTFSPLSVRAAVSQNWSCEKIFERIF